MTFFRRGQSLPEYSILLVIIIAAIITMQIYIKRGFQGRWKSAVDDFGDQYDPNKSQGNTTYFMKTKSLAQVSSSRDATTGNLFTLRNDTSVVTENRQSSLQVSY